MKTIVIFAIAIVISIIPSTFSFRNTRILTQRIFSCQNKDQNQVEYDFDSVIEAQFSYDAVTPDMFDYKGEYTDYKGRKFTACSPEKAAEAKSSFQRMRSTLVVDSIFVSILGLCAVWSVGLFKDAFSYSIGAGLGIAYMVLLGRYVGSIGSSERQSSALGGLRFAPVVLLVLLYSKNKTTISFIPEFLGFFSFQLASLLQAFNENLYKDNSFN